MSFIYFSLKECSVLVIVLVYWNAEDELELEISSYLLEIPNHAYTLLSLILIGWLFLIQDYWNQIG